MMNKKGLVIPYGKSYCNTNTELYDVDFAFNSEYIDAKYDLDEVIERNDEYFVNISHELKTPLNVIYSATQLIDFYTQNKTENSQERVLYSINSIKQNYFRLIKVINNFLDLSKLEAGQFTLNLSNVNIVNIIENMVHKVAHIVNEKQMKIIFDTNVEEKMIECDSENIERVFLNLISNAVKFSKPNSIIYVNISASSKNVVIRVTDGGIGIEKDNLDKIFERFGQVNKTLSRNAEGSGLGLCLSKAIVELHGGNISVESQIDKGSSFTIKLPVKAKKSNNNIFIKDMMLNCNNKDEMINIEFSDIMNTIS